MLIWKTIMWGCAILAILVVLIAMGHTFWLDLPVLNIFSPLRTWQTDVLINLAGFLMIMVAFLQQTISNRESDKDHSLQRFEDNFFQMIQFHHQNISLINERYQHDPENNESDFFVYTYEHLLTKIDKPIDEIKEEYLRIHAENQHFIDHFVHYLQTIIEYVWEDKTRALNGKEDKKKYLTILENQLPTAELWVFFVEILFQPGPEEEKSIFALHEDIPQTLFRRIAVMPIIKNYVDTFPYMRQKEVKGKKYRIFRK